VSKKWDGRWLQMAKHFASFSKDPSTGVGACAVDDRQVLISSGFNGFSRGVKDKRSRLMNRESRLARTAHAEINLIIHAGESLRGSTVYVWPMAPCSTCAAALIQAGVRRVVSPTPSPDLAARWGASLRLARAMLREAGVKVEMLDGE